MYPHIWAATFPSLFLEQTFISSHIPGTTKNQDKTLFTSARPTDPRLELLVGDRSLPLLDRDLAGRPRDGYVG